MRDVSVPDSSDGPALGKGCADDKACGAPPWSCAKPDGGSFFGGGPTGGYCTLRCDPGDAGQACERAGGICQDMSREGDPERRYECLLACVLVAGVYGGFTANKRIWLLQALPAALALAAVLLIGF